MKLQEAIREAARKAWSELRTTHPRDDFYYFALVTTGDALRPGPSASSEQGLVQVLADYYEKGASCDESDLRWSEADSPYCLFGDEYFGDVQRLFSEIGDHRQWPEDEYAAEIKRRYVAMENALRELDAEGFFGCGVARNQIVINVVAPGDDDEASIVDRAARLNPPESLLQLREDLGVPQGYGNKPV